MPGQRGSSSRAIPPVTAFEVCGAQLGAIWIAQGCLPLSRRALRHPSPSLRTLVLQILRSLAVRQRIAEVP